MGMAATMAALDENGRNTPREHAVRGAVALSLARVGMARQGVCCLLRAKASPKNKTRMFIEVLKEL